MRLRDVSTLTLHRGQYTTARRSESIPQLQCVGGSAGCKHAPQVVQCYNRGSDGIDVQWECRAKLNKNVEFGKIEVSCEGYDYPDDSYILYGSCGLKYQLNYADDNASDDILHRNADEWSLLGKIAVVACIAFIAYLVYLSITSPRLGHEGDRERNSYRGSPSSSNIPRGNPPPPGFKYNDAPPPYENCDSGTFSQSYGFNSQNTSGISSFLTGLGIGGLAGYTFGSRRSTYQESPFRHRQPYCPDEYQSEGFSRSYQSSSDSSVDNSQRTHESSGFGGTSRR